MPEKEKLKQAKCLYEILGLPRDCTQEQIRSSYKRLALQLHPDKLISSGTVSEEEATSAFQSLLNAYQVLSDPHERAFYDSHRSQILFSDPNSSSSSSSSPFGGPHVDVPHLFPFFSNSAYSSFSDTGKGFYKVYADIFNEIYAQEIFFAKELELGPDAVGQAPSMGNLDSPYAQVSAFYGFWLGFSTVMDFSWVDPYRSSAGPTRKARRVMEDENKKARKKARKEFNETVRSLAEFAKKRDKRVIEMQIKRNLEEERKRAEEKERKKEEARKKMEKARLYKEPEWARVEEEEDEEIEDDVFDDGRKGEKELYCVVCSKKFKSEKQWKNHEQSKKHREKVAELRDSYKAEEVDGDEEEEEEEEEVLGNGQDAGHVGFGSDVQADDNVYDLCAEFEVGVDFREERSGFRSSTRDQKGQEEGNDSFGNDEEESILEAMVSGHKNRKNANASQPKPSPMSGGNVYGDDEDELVSMEFDTRKSNRRSRVSKKAGGAKSSAEDPRVEADVPDKEVKSSSIDSEVLVDEDNADGVSPVPESSSHLIEEIGVNSEGDRMSKKNRKVNNQSVDRKLDGQRETNIKSRNASKGKKQKATSKSSSHSCEMCGEDFESKNKLHIHLGATGHAVLKSR